MKKQALQKSTIITRGVFPKSRKVYVNGNANNIKVAMREISLGASPNPNVDQKDKLKKNENITIYDTSGPYTDPSIEIDVKNGLPKLREQWILDRNDVELLKEISSDYVKERMLKPGLDHLRFKHITPPFRAKNKSNVTQLHYARKGIITPEMEYLQLAEYTLVVHLHEW